MDVEWETTNKKCKGDRKFFFTTKNKEPITLFKVCEMINLLAHNEWKIKNNGNWERYLFQEAIIGAIQHGKDGINWDDKSNINFIEKLCGKTHMKIELTTLSKINQKKVGDFDGHN